MWIIYALAGSLLLYEAAMKYASKDNQKQLYEDARKERLRHIAQRGFDMETLE